MLLGIFAAWPRSRIRHFGGIGNGKVSLYSKEMDLADLRKSYTKAGLLESEVDPDPVKQFGAWFQQATDGGGIEPNAMTLATANSDGVPNARIVLLKRFSEEGFVFFTNYESRKGRDLGANPLAALLFYWPELERQVRITGVVRRVPEIESDRYFATRPRGHQVGAAASPQSKVVADRAALERMWNQIPDGEVARPPHWGGYLVSPHCLEFWQGRPNRLHDRLEYVRKDQAWQIRRLAP